VRRFSKVAFAVSYCVAYFVTLATNCPLFLYYPEVGRWRWSWQPLADSGPAMAWYGIMAMALIAGLFAGSIVPDRWWISRRLLIGAMVPITAMAGCIYVMRTLLFA